MSDKVLYRAWRPLDFDQVVGQEHVVSALRQAAINGSIAHAYLFSGTRGTGKTSLAKIFARAINCPNISTEGNPCNNCDICQDAIKGTLLDIIEMDAASNNSVDDIRKITDEVLFLPTVAKYKVYIIDEVHMLSTAAFNALLKTLEEPPAHAVFILATTDPQRIPATILSRCQRYDFKRIKSHDMHDHLALIAKDNNINISEDGLLTIINFSEGALRDAISLLDQSRSIYADKVITRDDILNMVGVVSDEFLEKIIYNLVSGNVDELMLSIEKLIVEGGDISRFTSSLAQYLRNLLVYKTSRAPEKILQVNTRTLATLGKLAKVYSTQNLIDDIAFIANLQQELKYSENPRITLEVALIQLLQNVKNNRTGAELTEPKEKIEVEAPVKRVVESQDIEVKEHTQEVQSDKSTVQENITQASKPQETTLQEVESEDFDTNNSELKDSEPENSEREEIEPEPVEREATEREETEPEEIKTLGTSENSNSIALMLDPSSTKVAKEIQSKEQAKAKEETLQVTEQTSSPAKTFSPEELKNIWHKFINELNEQDPLLAILLNTCQYYVEDDKFIINFETEQLHIYDKINTHEVKSRVLQAFIEANANTHLSLEFNIAGKSAHEANIHRQGKEEPEWVQRMKAAAEAMDIPIQEEMDDID